MRRHSCLGTPHFVLKGLASSRLLLRFDRIPNVGHTLSLLHGATPAICVFTQLPVLPPFGITNVKLRGLHLMGSSFDFSYSATDLCVTASGTLDSVPLELRLLNTAKIIALPKGGPQVCVPIQAVAVAVPGY